MDTALDTSRSPVAAHELVHDLRFATPVVTAPPPPRSATLTFITVALSIVAIFVSAVLLSAELAEADGTILWVLVLMGAAIIAILLIGILLPYVKELRAHRRA